MAHFFSHWTAHAALALVFCAPAWGQMVVPPESTVDLANGDMSLPCLAVTLEGNLILGGGSFESGALTFDHATVTGSGGTLNVGGNLISTSPLDLSTSTVVLSDVCAPGTPSQISGPITVQNLVLASSGSTPATFVLPSGSNITVLGTITLGAPGSPVVLTSSGTANAIVTLGPNATVSNPSASVVPANVQLGAIAAPAIPQSVPTLSTYGILLLALLVWGMATRTQRRIRASSAQSTRH